MPSVSKAQNAAMHAAAEGKSNIGIPQSVGEEFTKDQAPGSVKDLPERVGKASPPEPAPEPEHMRKRRSLRRKASELHRKGLISPKQLMRMHEAADNFAASDNDADDTYGRN